MNKAIEKYINDTLGSEQQASPLSYAVLMAHWYFTDGLGDPDEVSGALLQDSEVATNEIALALCEAAHEITKRS